MQSLPKHKKHQIREKDPEVLQNCSTLMKPVEKQKKN
jgi:hypothetical protein